MEKCIIVAIADNNAIGRGGDMPWHISEDLKYFKRVTSGSPVIMGRRTFESIGRPLPKRTNIVVSRSGFAPDGTVPAVSLEEAFAIASDTATVADVLGKNTENWKCFIMGGGQIYAQAMDLADTLYITHIHTVVDDADTYFPAIDPAVWKVVSRSEMQTDPETGYAFEFVIYRRKS